MKISEYVDKGRHVNSDLKIIWDKAEPEQKFGKKIKIVIVADVDGPEGGPTAFLDLYNKDCDTFKFGDKIRVVDAYTKLMKNEKQQFRITFASRVEKLKNEEESKQRI
jgi:hypothetical protein